MERGANELMPRRSEIARYWLTREGRARFPENKALGDSGEPVCFCCGLYKNSWLRHDGSIGAWDLVSDLNKAHLQARQFGGSYEVSNLVLLCPLCHFDAPDTPDPEVMLAWLRRKAPRLNRSLFAQANEHADAVVAELEDLDPAAKAELEELARSQDQARVERLQVLVAEEISEVGGTHGSEVVPATSAVALARALQRLKAERVGGD